MSNPLHVLAQQLTGKQTVDECSLEEVKRLVQRYPYFAPAQFLLLHKLRQSGPAEEADAQYKKAVLFYPNPYAFEWFISSGRFFGTEAATPVIEPVEDLVHQNEKAGDKPVAEEAQALMAQPGPATIDTENTKAADDVLTSVSEKEEGLTVEPPDAELQSLPETMRNEESSRKGNTPEPTPGTSTSLTDFPVAPPAAVNASKTETPTQDPLLFEPYHTVDYFASQGIKISPDDLPKDKLGKQLKSFTEWLKTMKRLPAPPLTDDNAESTTEKGIESMAGRSVSESEVLTEAMAEVWAKQGIPQKALDIYNKLSLHNPSKRDYFAAKIENLKQF